MNGTFDQQEKFSQYDEVENFVRGSLPKDERSKDNIQRKTKKLMAEIGDISSEEYEDRDKYADPDFEELSDEE